VIDSLLEVKRRLDTDYGKILVVNGKPWLLRPGCSYDERKNTNRKNEFACHGVPPLLFLWHHTWDVPLAFPVAG
jgi:hypothetical protein